MGKLRASIVALVLVATAAMVASDAGAADPAVGVAEVTAPGGAVDVGALRAMVVEEVDSLDASRLPRGAHALLSVAVVKLDARDATPAEVTCVVSATLRDRTRGNVFAVVEGSAKGQDEPRRLHGLRHATLRAAVARAIARVPEAMQRRRR